jgi:4-hydroxy-tetrahydrodipicolinate reductase
MARIGVVFSGATGAVGRTMLPAILASDEFELVGAIARREIGEDVGLLVGRKPCGVAVAPTFTEAIAGRKADVLLDFSTSEAAAANCRLAVEAGVAVVLGTTAVDRQAIEEIGDLAQKRGVGVFLAPNLTIVGQLMFRCAELLRPYFGDVEIVDYHSSAKRDAPSGTALETAHRINATKAPPATKDQTSRGLADARGATVGEVHMHSVRLPSFYSRHEVLFSAPGQMLTIVCDQFTTEPLIGPTLKAARLVLRQRGVVRDLPGLFDPD